MGYGSICYFCRTDNCRLMDLQTVVKLDKPEFQIDYTTGLMMLGSCFVENIGAKLDYFKFNTDINPCGIVYNPMSVAETLQLLMNNKRLIEEDLLQNNNLWVSLRHHGRFSAPDIETCLQNINSRLERAVAHLKKTDVLIITWGTAWAYRHCATGLIVSNCHKFPASAFERFRLDVDGIVEEYTVIFRRLLEIRPSLKILLTVSPIRHWKDGAHANQLSKAVLLLATDRLLKQFSQVSYFPSYEIVMDELRDYRYYAEDMLHISPQGVNYIWEKFRDIYLNKDTRERMGRIDKLNKILLHRPSDPYDENYLQLRRATEIELQKLLEQPCKREE